MATQTTALAQQPRNASEEEGYRAFLDALSASARGRAFLAEYARRNANSDAGAFFSALENLRNTLGPDSSSQDQLSVKVKLRDLLEEIHHFFEVYKALEPHKDADVRGWDDRVAAEQAIEEARRTYAETHGA